MLKRGLIIDYFGRKPISEEHSGGNASSQNLSGKDE
jgi:hypothetical protein